jgi:hypothetical protein
MWGMACERTLGIPTANLGSSRSALWKDGFAEVVAGRPGSLHWRAAVEMLWARPPTKPARIDRPRYTAWPASVCRVGGVGRCPRDLCRRFSRPYAERRYIWPGLGCDQRASQAGAQGLGPKGLRRRSVRRASSASLAPRRGPSKGWRRAGASCNAAWVRAVPQPPGPR